MKNIWAGFALLVAGGVPLTATPAAAQVSLNISVNFAPPALPVYHQPPIPGPDYIWAPGYWAWDDYVQDYYWVPGTWVLAPRPGLLWTPPWWGWQNGVFLFHAGYWGPHVGFYGGVPYGFGYTGTGFLGAYWNGGHVFYNRSVTNITNVNVTNVYNKTVIVNRVTNVSYNGGPGGVQARPTAFEQAAMHESHVAPTPMQQQHFQAARANRQFFVSANRGRPPVAAVARPAQFSAPVQRSAAPAAPFGGRNPQPKPQSFAAPVVKYGNGSGWPPPGTAYANGPVQPRPAWQPPRPGPAPRITVQRSHPQPNHPHYQGGGHPQSAHRENAHDRR